MRKIFRLKALAIATIFLFEGVIAHAQEKYTLALNWVPHAIHYGIYVAQAKGWYRDNGLNIEIQRGNGSADTVKRIANGSAEFGLADAASIVVGRSNGLNVKLVAAVIGRAADAIYFVKNSNIKTPKDLEGKTMGAQAGETSLNLLPAFAKSAGIDYRKIEIVPMTVPSKIPSLVLRKVDTIVTFNNEEPMVIDAGKKAGLKIGRFLFADYGVDYYSVGLIVSDSMLAKNPKAVSVFVNETMRGYAYAIEHPEEAADIFAKINPASGRDLMLAQWRFVQANILTTTAREHGLGYIDEGKMAKTIALMKEFQNVTGDVKPSDIYTMRFLKRIDAHR